MATNRAFEVPKESELVEFFGAEPTERSVKDGFWAFAVTDERGVKLRFSFDLYERSVQTMLSVGEVVGRNGEPRARGATSHQGHTASNHVHRQRYEDAAGG